LVGYLLAVEGIKKEDLGLIEVKDYESYVAVRRPLVGHLLQHANQGKIKGKKIKIGRT